MDISSIKSRIAKECSVLSEIMDDHFNSLTDHKYIKLQDKEEHRYIERIISTIIDESDDSTINNAVEFEIKSIRTKTVIILSADTDVHLSRTKRLVHSHRHALKFRDEIPEIFDSRSTDRILQERVNRYNRFVGTINSLEEKLLALEFDEWKAKRDIARKEILAITDLSKEMAKDVAVYRKQLGDERREKWARWGLLLAVGTAAFGQADNALNNLKSIIEIIYEIFKSLWVCALILLNSL